MTISRILVVGSVSFDVELVRSALVDARAGRIADDDPYMHLYYDGEILNYGGVEIFVDTATFGQAVVELMQALAYDVIVRLDTPVLLSMWRKRDAETFSKLVSSKAPHAQVVYYTFFPDIVDAVSASSFVLSVASEHEHTPRVRKGNATTVDGLAHFCLQLCLERLPLATTPVQSGCFQEYMRGAQAAINLETIRSRTPIAMN